MIAGNLQRSRFTSCWQANQVTSAVVGLANESKQLASPTRTRLHLLATNDVETQPHTAWPLSMWLVCWFKKVESPPYAADCGGYLDNTSHTYTHTHTHARATVREVVIHMYNATHPA